jgi:hypothetical protein
MLRPIFRRVDFKETWAREARGNRTFVIVVPPIRMLTATYMIVLK